MEILAKSSKIDKISLSIKILIALILGLTVGLILFNYNEVPFIKNFILGFVFELTGQSFIRGIKMIVVPLVFFSLILGVSSIDNIAKIGRLGIRTLGFYLSTTALAVGIALFIGNLINPGLGVDRIAITSISSSNFTVEPSKPFIKILLNMIPSNPVAALANGDMLAIIVLSIFVGIAISIMGEKAEKVKGIVTELNALSLKLVEIIMYFAPYAVFALMAQIFAKTGLKGILPIMKYVFAVILALLILTTTVYPVILIFIAKYSPLKFFKKFFPVMALGFSTSSSAACLPTSIKTVENEFNIPNSIAAFTLPLGNTINMNGTSIMQGIATIFIAQFYGIELTTSNYISIIITATLASIGTAGVPGVGVIMLGMVLTEVGLPVEGVALIMGIDRIVDMFRTTINVTGDAVCTLALAKLEGVDLK